MNNDITYIKLHIASLSRDLVRNVRLIKKWERILRRAEAAQNT